MLNPNELSYSLVFADDDIVTEAEAMTQGGFTACVNRYPLKALMICEGADRRTVAAVMMRDGLRPIWGRLWRHTISNDTDSGQRLHAVVFGWQRTVKGVNVKCLTWVTHDGAMLVTDRDLSELEG